MVHAEFPTPLKFPCVGHKSRETGHGDGAWRETLLYLFPHVLLTPAPTRAERHDSLHIHKTNNDFSVLISISPCFLSLTFPHPNSNAPCHIQQRDSAKVICDCSHSVTRRETDRLAMPTRIRKTKPDERRKILNIFVLVF